MVGRRRDKIDRRVTIGDLARMYDQKNATGRADTSSQTARTSFGRRNKVKSFTVTQGDERYLRLKARVDGIRYALSTYNMTARQRKEMEQTLYNLELALKGMALTRDEDG